MADPFTITAEPEVIPATEAIQASTVWFNKIHFDAMDVTRPPTALIKICKVGKDAAGNNVAVPGSDKRAVVQNLFDYLKPADPKVQAALGALMTSMAGLDDTASRVTVAYAALMQALEPLIADLGLVGNKEPK